MFKETRGRKSTNHFHTMNDVDRKLLEERINKKLLTSKKNKEILDSFKLVLGTYLTRSRRAMAIPAEEIALKIGVNIAQLRKYETGDTCISAARFFVAACYLSHNEKSKDKNSFFNSLIQELQKLFHETKTISKEENQDLKTTPVEKIKKRLDEEIMILTHKELKKVCDIVFLINKNKSKIKNEDKNEDQD